MTPEAKTRVSIDALLVQTGWHVCGIADANTGAVRRVALGDFLLKADCDVKRDQARSQEVVFAQFTRGKEA